MANPYPIAIADADSGIVKMAGAATFTDPANQPGGGSEPLQHGVGSPVGAVTPTATGYVYIDTATGGVYSAQGATSSDWVKLGGVSASVGDTVGVSYLSPNVFVTGGADRDTPLNGVGATLTDAYSQWNGNGAGVKWSGNGTDGQQSLLVTTDAGTSTLHSASGNIDPAGTVINLPDPTNAQDAATKAYVDAFNGPLTSDLDAGGNDLTNVATVTGTGATHLVQIVAAFQGIGVSDTGVSVGGFSGGSIGFYDQAPVGRPTGVAVTAAGIHAALVSLGLITA